MELPGYTAELFCAFFRICKKQATHDAAYSIICFQFVFIKSSVVGTLSRQLTEKIGEKLIHLNMASRMFK